jgi:tripartite-type tricarboxylate transporter receptor subunit TctC
MSELMNAMMRPIALLFAAAAFVASAPAGAQTYPDRPIRMIVPFPPGGPVDITARIVTQQLAPILGQPVVVENRGGASGMIGGKMVANTEPDGYTILCGNISSLVVTPIVNRNRDFDPAKVFAPVAKLSQNYQVVVVAPEFGPKTVQELVAYAKANPGKLNFGSAGIGNASHLAAERFMQKTGIEMVHVPYKGAADAMTAVMGGQVQMFFGDIAGAMPLIRSGKLRPLAWSGPVRNPELPDMPTFAESGVDYHVITYIGVVAPVLTPSAILTKLNAAINQSLVTPAAAAAFHRIGAEVKPASAQDFGQFLADERAQWSEVVRRAAIKFN